MSASQVTAVPSVQLRTVAISAIVPLDGWNPRTAFDDAELKALSASMLERGCLVPVLVQASGDGNYRLVDGEKRYKAAVLASLMELPAIVRPADAGEDNTAIEGELLVDAVVANQLRSQLSPVEEALACRRLKREHGLTLTLSLLAPSASARATLGRFAGPGKPDAGACLGDVLVDVCLEHDKPVKLGRTAKTRMRSRTRRAQAARVASRRPHARTARAHLAAGRAALRLRDDRRSRPVRRRVVAQRILASTARTARSARTGSASAPDAPAWASARRRLRASARSSAEREPSRLAPVASAATAGSAAG